MRRAFVPTVAAILWISVLGAIAATDFATKMVSRDGDTALHVSLGERTIDRRGLLPVEPTALVSGDRPFVQYEWLSQVLWGAAHRALGMAGPVVVSAVVVASAFFLLLSWTRARGASPWPAILPILAAAIVAQNHLAARPHLFTWLLGLAWWLRLADLREGRLSAPRWIVGGIPLVVLWTNLHGGFLLAFILIGVEIAATILRAAVLEPGARRPALARAGALLAGLAAFVLASGINPYGFGLHRHLLGFLANPYLTQASDEWMSPDFHLPVDRVYLAFALGTFALLVAGSRRPPPGEVLGLLAVFAMSLVSGRNEVLFALFAAPVAARRLEDLLTEQAARPTWAGGASRAVLASSGRVALAERGAGGWALALAALAGLVAWDRPVPFDPDTMPVEAARWVRDHPDRLHGEMFNVFAWGGYLAYEIPDRKVYIHGLLDHYGESGHREFHGVLAVAPGWEAVLERRGVGWAILRPAAPLARALEREKGWEVVYRDDRAIVLAERPSGE